jgi:hypothetical protein
MCRLRARIGVRVASSALVPVFITVVLAADEKGVAAEVLDERVSGADDSRAAELFEATHRSQSGLQPSVIGFDRIVSVLLGDMTGRRHQLIEHPWVGGRAVSGHLDRGRPVLQGVGEELPGGRQVPLLGDQHVDDLPELVDCSVVK